MATSTLLTHCGARIVTREELSIVKAPPCTSTWFPLSHMQVLQYVEEQLVQCGFGIRQEQLALTRNDQRFFATLDLQCGVMSGVSLAVGIRNSIDKSLPIAFCAGNRVFVCDNLCFRSEIAVVRKHTRNGGQRFQEALTRAVQGLEAFRQAEAERIRRFMYTDLSPEQADSLLLRSFECGIISSVLLPRVIAAWRQPEFEDFKPRTLWSLLNAFTASLSQRHRSNPQQFAATTMALQALLENPHRRLEILDPNAA